MFVSETWGIWAGVPAEFVVFDALPHLFWGNPDLPVSQEALAIQVHFLARRVETTEAADRAAAARPRGTASPR
jgi:hypothetical protein